MEYPMKKRNTKRNLIAALLLCALLPILGIGGAFARYETNEANALKMQVVPNSGNVVLTLAEETKAENAQTMKFTLANGSSQTQKVSLMLLATEGLANVEKVKVSLTEGGNTYKGTCETLVEGTRLYELYGSGWMYHFYDKEGKDVTWELAGGANVTREMSISITGMTTAYPGIFRVIADGNHRMTNQDILSFNAGGAAAEVPVVKEQGLKSDLLTANGQTILIDGAFETKKIPVKLSFTGTPAQLETEGIITAVTSDAERLTAVTDITTFKMNGEEITATLTLTQPQKVEEAPDTGDTNTGDGSTEDSSSDGSTTEGSGETEMVSEPLTVEVTATYESKTLKATIRLVTADESAAGALAFAPSQYDPQAGLTLINGNDADTRLTGFPMKTVYQIGNQTYLMYDTGIMLLPKGASAKVTVPAIADTELQLKNHGETVYTISKAAVPKLTTDNTPFVIGEKGRAFPQTLTWGKATTSIKIQQLVKENNGYAWIDAVHIKSQVGKDKLTTLIPTLGTTKAGTYRATVTWTEQEYTLAERKIVFYVQYENRYSGEGGNGQ